MNPCRKSFSLQNKRGTGPCFTRNGQIHLWCMHGSGNCILDAANAEVTRARRTEEGWGQGSGHRRQNGCVNCGSRAYLGIIGRTWRSEFSLVDTRMVARSFAAAGVLSREERPPAGSCVQSSRLAAGQRALVTSCSLGKGGSLSCGKVAVLAPPMVQGLNP